MKRTLPYLLVFAACAALPALSLWPSGGYLAAPMTELPVRLWIYRTFGVAHVLGGWVDAIGYPDGGMLNNPDPLGTLLYHLLLGLGSETAFNVPILLHLWGNMVAAWLLARAVTRDDLASVTAAVSFGLAPLVLAYPVMCAVTDMAILWPYPLALRALLGVPDRPRAGLVAGLWVGVGFVTCPYHAVVFGALVVPAGIWLGARLILARHRRAPLCPVLAPWIRAALYGIAGWVLAAGWYVVWMRGIMGHATSQMSDDLLAFTRPIYPYLELLPSSPRRYTAYLVDWFAVGKPALVSADFVSRFYRAFSPGILVWALAAVGLLFARGHRRMAGGCLLAVGLLVVASTGPYLPVTRSVSLRVAANPVWMAFHYLLPGGTLILEPLRYGFPAILLLAVTAAIGVRALRTRQGRWVALIVPGLVVAETAILSPIPVPLPTWRPVVSPAMARLDEVLPEGPVVQLPFFDRGSQRLARMHFLDQGVHRRPIPDEVTGLPPRYVASNQFLAAMIQAEMVEGEMRIDMADPKLVHEDMLGLAQDGFVGLVLKRGEYRSPAHAARALHIGRQAGPATRIEDVEVIRLPSLPTPEDPATR